MKRTALIMLAIGLFFFVQTAPAQWTPAKRITWTSGDSGYPGMAIDSSGHLHVVWQDMTPGNNEIYCRTSTDGGSTWISSKRLTWTTGLSEQPVIAADSSGRLHVAWQDNTTWQWQIYYKNSEDGGSTWSTTRAITGTSGDSFYADLAAGPSDHLHMVWNAYPQVYYKTSTDGGGGWTTGRRLTWSGGLSGYPALAVDSSGDLHVVWDNDATGKDEIYYKKSTDEGVTWTATKRITWTSGGSYYSAIAPGASQNIHVVWNDNTPGNYEIYHKKSTNRGDTWTATKRITWTSGTSWLPAIALDPSGDLHVVWQDFTPGKAEIYYKKSTDGGDTWSTTQRITWTSDDSYRPAMAVDSSGNLHVVWQDETPGNTEIYYKKYVKK
jgi:hypothetical protein